MLAWREIKEYYDLYEMDSDSIRQSMEVLKSWNKLVSGVTKLSETQLVWAIDHELRKPEKRHEFIIRLKSRYNILRAKRELAEILK